MIAALLALILAAAPAEDADRAQAATLITEGNELLDAGDAAEALKRFTEAHDLFPTPKILLSIAEAQLKLGNSVRAAELYQRFLEEKPEGTPAKLIMLAEQRMEELAEELATVKIDCPLEGALVSVDDDPVGETPIPTLFLKPGLYRISVTKEGFVGVKETADLAGGETRTVAAKLEPVQVEPAKPAPPPPVAVTAPSPPPPEERDLLGAWWLWTAGAVLLTGLTVGIVAGASGGGDDFVPAGELGLSGTSTWRKL